MQSTLINALKHSFRLEQNRQYWDYVDDGLLARMKGVCRVKFYITDDADGRKQLEGWLAGIDQPYSLASPVSLNDCKSNWLPSSLSPLPYGASDFLKCGPYVLEAVFFCLLQFLLKSYRIS